MSELYVSTSSWTEQTREPYSDDSWDRGDTWTSISIDQVSTKKIGENIASDDDILVGDEVYIVWAHWGSGDTFGRDDGCSAEFYLATKDEAKAEALVTALNKAEAYKPVNFYGYQFYCPWFGYFESLESINIDKRVVQ